MVAYVIYRFAFKNILSTIKEREKQIADSLKMLNALNWNWRKPRSSSSRLSRLLLKPRRPSTRLRSKPRHSSNPRKRMLVSKLKLLRKRKLPWNRRGSESSMMRGELLACHPDDFEGSAKELNDDEKQRFPLVRLKSLSSAN